MNNARLFVALLLLGASASARAGETVAYRYDAKGRLVAVTHGGTAGDALSTTYRFDKADNRIERTVAGARAAGVVVVPLGGLRVLPMR